MDGCIYCFSKEYRLKFELQDIYKDRHRLCECTKCGVFFLNPLPNQDQLKRAYSEDYYGEGEKKFNKLVESVVDWFRKKKAKQFSNYLESGAKVLDVGCGNGNSLHYIGMQGNYELHGIEPEGKSAERASTYESINLHKGYLEEGKFVDGYFDAILFTHVFEHLHNPNQILNIVQQISKSGTILQIEIPNIASWQSSLFKNKWFHLDPPRHLNMFPPSVLKREVTKNDWELVSESYFSPQFSVFGVQQSFLNTICSRRDLLYEHLKGNKSYTKNFNRFVLLLHQLFHWLTFPLFVVTDVIASMFKRGGTVKFIFKRR